jgi:hypothetical protein
MWLVTLPLHAQSPCSTGTADGKPLCSAGSGEISCKEDGSGYQYSFTVTNNTGSVVTSVLVTPPVGSNYTITPQQPPLPGGSLADGHSVTLHVTITGGQAGQEICFAVTLMTEKKTCCTVTLCVILPNCCATVETLKLVCNPNGTYTYTFTIKNKTPNTIQHIYLYPPPGVTMTPSYFAVSLLPNATSPPLVVTISGASPGRFCFDISLHTPEMKCCCVFQHCIELPKCGTQSACGPAACCSRAPVYVGTQFTGQKIAAVTGWRHEPNIQNNVLTVFDISGANAMPLWTNSAPPKYTGPPGSEWTYQNLGSIFGVTIDHLGNIYVTASPVYTLDPPQGSASAGPADFYPGGPGKIYKIRTGDGKIDPFFNPTPLPNTPDPNITGPEAYPALGNISFDCPSKQLFVTNFDDGRIYRLNSAGVPQSTWNHATKSVAAGGSADPNDTPGFAPLGSRLWAVQAHDGRIFYGVWREDCANPDQNVKNEIWSVGLTPGGDFDAADWRKELDIPDLPGQTFSNPPSDLSFAWDGRMLVSERTMGCSTPGTPACASCTKPAYAPTTSNAHAARILEFMCTRTGWVLTPPIVSPPNYPYKYNVGEMPAAWLCSINPSNQPANAAGGIDYDFDTTATYRVWGTGDYLKSPIGSRVYGIQGFPLAGGTVAGSPIIGLYGIGSFKRQLGDVEVSCPPGENPY